MPKEKGLICTAAFAGLLLYAFVKPVDNYRQENQPPAVKIITPKTNSFFGYDTQINYEINVVDKEDGNSKYDEINAKEVLLEVRYAASTAQMNQMINTREQNDPAGLALMRSSNCFNCHNFKSKSIGPSFAEIAAKYQATTAHADTMIKRIRQGSSGVWGKEVMPTHPELTAEETKSIVQWMMKAARDHSVDYYIGLTGSFRISAPAPLNKNGRYILTASYTDHGLKNGAAHHLKGQDVAEIFGRK